MSLNAKIKIFFLFVICQSHLVHGQINSILKDKDKSKEIQSEFLRFMGVGDKAFEAGNYPKALEYYTRAELLSEKNDYEEGNIISKFNIAKVYSEIHTFGDALKYYNEALDIVRDNPKEEVKSLTILSNIGNLYSSEGDHLTALEYYEKVHLKAKQIKSDYNIVLSAINISDVYIKLGNYQLARKYLDQLQSVDMRNDWRQTMNVNYAEAYFKEGKIKEAEKIMSRVWGNVDNANENHCFLCVVKLLSEINSANGKIGSAIKFAKEGLKNSRSLKDHAEMYELLADVYYKDSQYKVAFQYKDSLMRANDSLYKLANSSLYATHKIKLKIQDYKSEAKHNLDKRKSERNLFLLIIVLGIVLFYFIYRSLRNRIIKQKQESIIAGNKQKIYELELDKLTSDIAEKNRKLSAKALYLSGRNELIEEVINALEQVPEIQRANVNNHIKALRTHLKTDEEWDDFISYFEQVNPNFLKTLQSKHPQLNQADIRFICYLYMNLDLKEISSIFSITVEAARKRKQRIAKKIDIDIDLLNEYILKLT